MIIGNVALYGATGGKAFFRGIAAERFCVRNSGASAVVEGVGDHGCEYMTGGVAVVLGATGRNFAAGMSGGVAFVFDPEGAFEQTCNAELVDLDPVVTAEDEALLHGLVSEHAERTGSEVAAAILGDWFASKKAFVKVYPRDYKRVIEAQKAAEQNEKEAAELAEADAFERLKAISSLAAKKEDSSKSNNALPLKVRPTRTEAPKKTRGFVEYEREPLGYRDAEARLKDWKEVHRHDSSEETKTLLATQSARCMDCGTPFCHQTRVGVSPREQDSGVERARAPGAVAGRARPPPRDEQLPRVHRARVPRAVRGELHARDHREPRHDQVHRVHDRRPRLRGGLDRPPPPR